MKKLIFSILLLCVSLTAMAQAQTKYGCLSYNALLRAMPEYKEMRLYMDTLRMKYEKEAQYNQQEFEKMFGDYLQGQKDFPKNILEKRQRDLQEAMEKNLAFRHDADSLLKAAEEEMTEPIRKKLNAAIHDVGIERGYECIINTDINVYPFVHQAVSEDATPFVEEKIMPKK